MPNFSEIYRCVRCAYVGMYGVEADGEERGEARGDGQVDLASSFGKERFVIRSAAACPRNQRAGRNSVPLNSRATAYRQWRWRWRWRRLCQRTPRLFERNPTRYSGVNTPADGQRGNASTKPVARRRLGPRDHWTRTGFSVNLARLFNLLSFG